MIKVRVAGQGRRFGPVLIERVKERFRHLRTIVRVLPKPTRLSGQSKDHVVGTGQNVNTPGQR